MWKALDPFFMDIEKQRAFGALGGRPPNLEARALREAIYRKCEEHAEELSEVILKNALAGDMTAWKELADRVFGKAQQGINVNVQLPRPELPPEEVLRLQRVFEVEPSLLSLTDGLVE